MRPLHWPKMNKGDIFLNSSGCHVSICVKSFDAKIEYDNWHKDWDQRHTFDLFFHWLIQKGFTKEIPFTRVT